MAYQYPTKDATITLTVKTQPKEAKGQALLVWTQCHAAFADAKGNKIAVEAFVTAAAEGRRTLRRGCRFGYLKAV